MQFLTATWPTLHTKNSKNQKCAITLEHLAARRHNVNVPLGNGTFLIFCCFSVWCRPCRR